MNSYNHGFSQTGKAKSKFTIVRIIIIIVLCVLLAAILYLGNPGNPGRNKPGNQGNPSNPPKTDNTETLEPSAGIVKPTDKEIPAVTINLDGVGYKIQGTKAATEAASLPGKIKTVSMGKGSMLHMAFDEQPDLYNIKLYKDDKLVFTGKTPIILPEDIPTNGEYRAVCEAAWNTDGYSGTANYYFNIAADFPPLPIISSTETVPGELLVIVVKYLDPDEKLEVVTDLDFKPNIFEYEYKKVILQPVSYFSEQNKVYSIKLLVGDETYSYAIDVNEKEFVVQQLTIDTKVAAETRNDKSAQEVKDKIDPLRPVCDEVPYWTSDFIMPVEGGRVREYDFGKRRYVNGSPTSYRHNGLDIGHDEGVPVMASNNGRVLIADYMIGTGNTVIIEHGFGLKTWYYHMSELNVKTGDMVEKGQIIGKVGSTGFSTGPHLHFSSSINNAYINPITLINEGVPLLAID